MIPSRIIFRGSKEGCQRVLGRANSLMEILKDRLSRGELQQGWSHHILPGGEIIKCGMQFGVPTLIITAPNGGNVPIPEFKECLCNCNFSIGQVLERSTEKYDSGIAEYYVYNVLCCLGGNSYILYQNILATDFVPYYVGQTVVVMAYKDFIYDCCRRNYNATGCYPVIDIDNVVHTEDWRTTYRIVPFCAASMPQWEAA